MEKPHINSITYCVLQLQHLHKDPQPEVKDIELKSYPGDTMLGFAKRDKKQGLQVEEPQPCLMSPLPTLLNGGGRKYPRTRRNHSLTFLLSLSVRSCRERPSEWQLAAR